VRRQGGLLCVTAVPNSLSDDRARTSTVSWTTTTTSSSWSASITSASAPIPRSATSGFHRLLGRAPDRLGALSDGLESPADGPNIVRGLIARGYVDEDICNIAGQNALDFLRRTIG
jgi:microsomal dipeptidase-like Zn-dependent dipeptidase